MDEEMEYAEMLEIPVSTVNVTKKRSRKTKKTQDLKERVITKVNDAPIEKLSAQNTQSALFASPENLESSASGSTQDSPTAFSKDSVSESENLVIADSTPIAIPRRKKKSLFSQVFGKTDSEWDFEEKISTQEATASDSANENLPIYNYNLWDNHKESAHSQREKRNFLIVAIEFAACVALCLGIFLTNVFVPNSAINTFFRSLTKEEQVVDSRTYSDFQLSAILSEEDAELTLSPTGIISFTEAGCIYPAVDGTVDTITQNNDGTWTVKISHSNTFSEIISGVSYLSCSVGSEVKANIPLGYSDGQAEVQVSMYESGALLNCFYLTESGDLAWTEE